MHLWSRTLIEFDQHERRRLPSGARCYARMDNYGYPSKLGMCRKVPVALALTVAPLTGRFVV